MAAKYKVVGKPTPTKDTVDVIEGLRRKYDEMTQSQKRVAQYIVENADTVAFSTVDQMASKLGVNPSTIVRFTYRLGLKGFPDLQARIQDMVRGQLSRAADNAEDGTRTSHLAGTSFGATLEHDLKNLQRTIHGLTAEDLTTAVETITGAQRVCVTAGYSSYPVAHYFGLILSRLRKDVTLLGSDNGLSVGWLADMGSQDCVVAFTFPRYAASTHRIAALARDKKAKVIAITDTPISAVGQIANVVLLASSAGAGIQNSLVGPMAVANALLNGVAAEEGARALARYTRHDEILNNAEAFVLKFDKDDEP